MRGKFVVGNTATGILRASYTPTIDNITIKKMIDFECRANQYLSDCSAEGSLMAAG
jgi:hypothetical protein